MNSPAPVDLSPGAAIAAIGALLATLALALAWWRQRGAPALATPAERRQQRLHGLTLLTLFLTFDLVVFGAYTRLSDSGLGCPDWPGCYAAASPAGAHAHISSAQADLPSGPVTHTKAWIEMVHRYLATAVGALITLIMGQAWWSAWQSRQAGDAARHANGMSPGWATLCFVWVCLQGAFGAFTVTLKLYPAIVTLHLLGGVGLLALLAVAARRSAVALQRTSQDPGVSATPTALGTINDGLRAHRPWLQLLLVLLIAQITLGGWVSTNYAVLACSDFPLCHGSWWPDADFRAGFTVLRELGRQGDGSLLGLPALKAIHLTHRMGALVVLACSDFPLCHGSWWPEADFRAGFTVLRELGRQADGSLLGLPALTAIHLTHRIGALVVLAAVALAAWRLRNARPDSWQARALRVALALLLLQVLTGISNVVLGWPLLAALAHTGGAAALLALLAALLTRPIDTLRQPVPAPAADAAPHTQDALSTSSCPPR